MAALFLQHAFAQEVSGELFSHRRESQIDSEVIRYKRWLSFLKELDRWRLVILHGGKHCSRAVEVRVMQGCGLGPYIKDWKKAYRPGTKSTELGFQVFFQPNI
ncbi:hypothetical protein ES319_A11G139100v1 [Gossypium barbadense]|uniref:Uncharacterized protein n=2 Tax=Gossypium TaxID=3633 RepID=A0A5J5TMI7_GOSBA|nr:hypothetical protein ES319_A11G139100v1 [Gossypium barbadense]TYG93907.1 hypothetical protein ES288_A11G148400v1 [Gossypium darwinii]